MSDALTSEDRARLNRKLAKVAFTHPKVRDGLLLEVDGDIGRNYVAQVYVGDVCRRIFYTLDPENGGFIAMCIAQCELALATSAFPIGETFCGYPIVYNPQTAKVYVVADEADVDRLKVARPLCIYPIPDRFVCGPVIGKTH